MKRILKIIHLVGAPFNQRDYKVEGQLGQENTPEEFVGNLVAICEEVRRVIRGDGTFWLNIGRMLFTILLAVHAPPIFRIVFHDYLAAGTTVIWLFVFWWFAYSFILEEREPVMKKKTIKV